MIVFAIVGGILFGGWTKIILQRAVSVSQAFRIHAYNRTLELLWRGSQRYVLCLPCNTIFGLGISLLKMTQAVGGGCCPTFGGNTSYCGILRKPQPTRIDLKNSFVCLTFRVRDEQQEKE